MKTGNAFPAMPSQAATKDNNLSALSSMPAFGRSKTSGGPSMSMPKFGRGDLTTSPSKMPTFGRREVPKAVSPTIALEEGMKISYIFICVLNSYSTAKISKINKGGLEKSKKDKSGVFKGLFQQKSEKIKNSTNNFQLPKRKFRVTMTFGVIQKNPLKKSLLVNRYAAYAHGTRDCCI